MEKQILKIADDAQQGLCDPLTAYIELKRIEKILSDCLKLTQPLAVQEADKNPEKSFIVGDVKVEKRRSAGKWDYSGIEQWNRQKEAMKEIEELSKQAFQAQAKGRNLTITDMDGVIIQPASFIEGSDTIAIKFNIEQL